MRCKCRFCGSVARITSSNEISLEVTHLYCQCTNDECNAVTVRDNSYSHCLRPPTNDIDTMFLDRFYSMGKEQQQQLLRQMTSNNPTL